MTNKKQTFEDIVSTAYDKKEFEVPEIEQMDDYSVSDFEHPEHSSSSTVVRRGLGDAAVTEMLSSSGNTTILKDGDGEIIHQELPGGNILVVETRDGVTSSKAVTPEGTFQAHKDDTLVPLNIELPEIDRHIEKWRNDT